VLKGFGNFLKNVKILHVETEVREIFFGQKLQKDVVELMENKGFIVVDRKVIGNSGQEDLIFLRKDLHF
jgi:hypothetical protein